jgi:hypothetical protein
MIFDALTYNGSVFDTILNAVVLVVLCVAVAVQARRPWLITFVTLAIVQVALWFGLGATGISVVWSGLAGAALVDLVSRPSPTPRPSLAEARETPNHQISDRETPDRGTPDGEAPDGGIPDRGTPDRGTPDRGTPDRRWMLRAALVVAFAAIAYYAVALPLISTVAHLLALVVGAAVHLGARRLVGRTVTSKTPAVRESTRRGCAPSSRRASSNGGFRE